MIDPDDDAHFDALIERSSLGTSGARQLRRRTSHSQVDTVRQIMQRRDRIMRSTAEDFVAVSDNDPGAATAMLRQLLGRLRRTLAERPELGRERADLATVLTVLSVEHLDRREPMIATVLRERPAATPTIGALWAEVLRSRPHRAAAIEALRTTLEALTALTDDTAIPIVQALGEALHSELATEELRLLQRDLTWTADQADDSEQLLRHLLDEQAP